MKKYALMGEKVFNAVLELERSKVNYHYHHETYIDSMSVVDEQSQKLKFIGEDSNTWRDEQIEQMERLTKLMLAYRLHTQDHNFALLRLRHGTSALLELLHLAKTLLTENSSLNQSREEIELHSLIRRIETVHFRKTD
jgi:hypothetical protein